jgi:hypothetical protein
MPSVFLVFGISTNVAGQSPDPAQVGQWDPVINWPLEAIHMVMLNTGKVLAIGRAFPDCNPLLPERYCLFDPESGVCSEIAGPPDPPGADEQHFLFCAGHSALSDGRIVFNGGFLDPNVFKTSIFDPLAGPNGAWTTLAEETDIGRFYPTLTTLASGEVLVMAGRTPADPIEPIYTTPVIFDRYAPLGSQFTLLTDARYCRLAGCGINPCSIDCSTVSNPDNQFLVHWYPFMFQLSTGKILYAGEDEWPVPEAPVKTRLFDSAGLGSWEEIVASDDPITGGSAALFRPDKVIKTGGIDGTTQGLDDVYRLDAASANPQWEAIDSLTHARLNFYLIALPDGSLLAVGGNSGPNVDPVLTPELLKKPDDSWIPANPLPGTEWLDMAEMTERRGYHSCALLLPDARVLVAGGENRAAVPPGQCPTIECNCPGPNCRLAECPQKTAQIYSPPYLFAPDGSPAARPVIDYLHSGTLGPDLIRYNTQFTVLTPEGQDITAVSLIRPGAATHSYDQDQRFTNLDFTVCGTNALRVMAPYTGNDAPPGYYMLFILANGVPSAAQFIRLGFAGLELCVVIGGIPWEGEGSRYLAATPGTVNCPVALHVTGDPGDPRVACVSQYVQADGSLGPSAYFQRGEEWATVHVHDHEIIPNAVYRITLTGCEGPISDTSSALTWLWGDTNNDGLVDVDDLICLVAAFAGDFTLCSFYAADLVNCENPERLIDVEDLIAIVDAFAWLPYPGSLLNCVLPCSGGAPGGAPEGPSGPEGPEGPMGPGSFQATINLTASPTSIKPNQTVSVQAFLTSSTTTRAFQVAVTPTGGTSGTLTVESVNINDTQTNYLFYGLNDLPATDVQGARLAATLFSGSVPAVLQKYLGTFTFRASADANGTFIVTLRPLPETLLRDANCASVTWEAGLSATVVVQGD